MRDRVPCEFVKGYIPAFIATFSNARSSSATVRVVCQTPLLTLPITTVIAMAPTLNEGHRSMMVALIPPYMSSTSARIMPMPKRFSLRRVPTRNRHCPFACSSISARTCNHPQRPIARRQSRSACQPSSTLTSCAGREARSMRTSSVRSFVCVVWFSLQKERSLRPPASRCPDTRAFRGDGKGGFHG